MNNKKKATPKVKESVKLRFKQLKDGSQSIYFDIYRHGKRVYEFPKLYIVPERTPIDKATNAQTLELANKIKAEKILELANNENGYIANSFRQKANFIDYVRALGENKKKAGIKGVEVGYRGLANHLTTYRGDTLTFKHITKDYCKGFVEYLKTAKNGTYKRGVSGAFPSGLLSLHTQYAYCRLLSVVLNDAVREQIIPSNPMKGLTRYESLKKPDSDREYLTIDEVRKLVQTPCIKPIVKQAFLFCCFSGLRFSDVKMLKWGDIQTDNEGKKIVRFKQQKTSKEENLQIADDAMKFLPDRGDAKESDIIFTLSGNGYTNQALASWVLSAGINKRVTFHVSRHTNATLLLSLGVPIETVSKLLGHTDIKTTQIYAKVIDKNKREAVSKLDGLIEI